MDFPATNADAELRRNLRRFENRMHPQYALRFDGTKLALHENGKEIVSWPAVSGRPGLQGQQHQLWVDHGPLPTGGYDIRVDQIQRITDWEDTKGRIGVPNWSGGRPSWGNYRAWLMPQSHTKTHGRGGFAIHGGSSPGSAGCIDLVDRMDEFVDLMRAIGQDQVDVTVDYGHDGDANHRRDDDRARSYGQSEESHDLDDAVLAAGL